MGTASMGSGSTKHLKNLKSYSGGENDTIWSIRQVIYINENKTVGLWIHTLYLCVFATVVMACIKTAGVLNLHSVMDIFNLAQRLLEGMIFSRWYFTGVIAAELRRHQSNMNVVIFNIWLTNIFVILIKLGNNGVWEIVYCPHPRSVLLLPWFKLNPRVDK